MLSFPAAWRLVVLLELDHHPWLWVFNISSLRWFPWSFHNLTHIFKIFEWGRGMWRSSMWFETICRLLYSRCLRLFFASLYPKSPTTCEACAKCQWQRERMPGNIVQEASQALSQLSQVSWCFLAASSCHVTQKKLKASALLPGLQVGS